ncbi:TetR/AcrR family transcriptional regulator [Phormidium tenue FACHB-886]|nr:TetR/AcrR family transcriptional regulator [Phormidium tenue FACHB-886]
MKGETAQQILDVAQNLVRSRGYSAFSYADISEQVGIRKASIHYHFSSKEELAKELVIRYRETVRQVLQHIEQTASDPQEQLIQFCRLYQNGVHHKQMCLCGILSAEVSVLPETVQCEIEAFFSETEAWLAGVLQRGLETGRLKPRISSTTEAALVLATLQGAQLIARSSKDGEATFERLLEQLLAALASNG